MTAPTPKPPTATTRPEPRPYDVADAFLWTHLAKRQARELGLTAREVDDAVVLPAVTYPNRRYPSQERRIRGRVCAVVDPARGVLVAVFRQDRPTTATSTTPPARKDSSA